jgi:folate-binding protein YgfZ
MVRERIFQTFDKFIIMDDVTLEDLTGAWGTLDVVGPKAAAVVADAAKFDIAPLAVLSHAEAQIAAARCRVVRRVRFGEAAATILVPREELANVWRDLETHVRAHGGIPVGMEAIETLRLEAGNPWFGEDFDDRVIPHEAGLENSHISYDKGCYTGQEIVERVRSRGHANRRLTSLQFDGAEAPPSGTKLMSDGKEVGNVTSSRFSPLLNRAIGLGYVRREFLGIGTRLDASGRPAEVIVPPRK